MTQITKGWEGYQCAWDVSLEFLPTQRHPSAQNVNGQFVTLLVKLWV